MIRLVAFDWNGTLLADTQTVVDCTNIEISYYKLKPQTIKEYRDTFIIPVNQFLINIGADPKAVAKTHQDYAKVFHEHYEKRVKRTRTRQGTKALLKFINNRKIQSVVFSNHAKHRVKEQTDRLKITQFFQEILGNDQVGDAYTIKGKEKRLIEYMKKKSIKPNQVLMVGDTDEEIIIAKDMGAKSVAITNGHNSTKRLRNANPDFLISNLGEIKAILAKIA